MTSGEVMTPLEILDAHWANLDYDGCFVDCECGWAETDDRNSHLIHVAHILDEAMREQKAEGSNSLPTSFYVELNIDAEGNATQTNGTSFYKWLDQIRAEAWDECMDSAYIDPVNRRVVNRPNPYKDV